jgi:hypothetical protein
MDFQGGEGVINMLTQGHHDAYRALDGPTTTAMICGKALAGRAGEGNRSLCACRRVDGLLERHGPSGTAERVPHCADSDKPLGRGQVPG